MDDLISVVVTTYNRPDALDAVLRGLARQNDRAFEVVIADDGSGASTEQCVSGWKARNRLRIEHVWQEDRGFRAAEARNKAILASRGQYCIFLDGDCVPRAGFIEAHRRLAERGWFVAGNRILLSEALTQAVVRDGFEIEKLGFGDFMRQRMAGGINRIFPLLDLSLGWGRKLRANAWRGARSCNLAVWRADLDLVDGYDASISGWGKEDSDLIARLLHAGVRRKDGNFATGVLHLWHPEFPRDRLDLNEAKLQRVIGAGTVRAERGLSATKAVPARLSVPSADRAR
jgi:glycosyltransferase involved in cell wall biosynthesis